MNRKLVLLNSGGIDSLASAKKLKEMKFTVYSLFIQLGQPQQVRTKRAAKLIAKEFCYEHEVVRAWNGRRFVGSAATGFGKNVPWLNQVVFVLGAVYAETRGIKFLASGITEGPVEPGGFLYGYVRYMGASNIRDIVVPVLPIWNWTDEEIITYVGPEELLRKTYSCNHPIKCGKCPKCKKRLHYGVD